MVVLVVMVVVMVVGLARLEEEVGNRFVHSGGSSEVGAVAKFMLGSCVVNELYGPVFSEVV
jgi:hypothetical protein